MQGGVGEKPLQPAGPFLQGPAESTTAGAIKDGNTRLPSKEFTYCEALTNRLKGQVVLDMSLGRKVNIDALIAPYEKVLSAEEKATLREKLVACTSEQMQELTGKGEQAYSQIGFVIGHRDLVQTIQRKLGGAQISHIRMTATEAVSQTRSGFGIDKYYFEVITKDGQKSYFSVTSERELTPKEVLHALKHPSTPGEKAKSFFRSIGRELANVGIVTAETATRCAGAIASGIRSAFGLPQKAQSWQTPPMSHDALYEEYSTKKCGVVKSTTYHSAEARAAGVPGGFTSDYASVRQLENGVKISAVCDGLDHYHCASGAAQQIAEAATELAQQDQYRIMPDDSEGEIKRKLNDLAMALRELKLKPEDSWEGGLVAPSTALAFSVELPQKGGQKRVVGFNIGDTSVMIYRKSAGTLELVSEPQQKCKEEKLAAYGNKRMFGWTPCFIPRSGLQDDKTHLAQAEDIRLFDAILEKDDFTIAATDGLLDQVPLPDHNQNPVIQQRQAARTAYYEAIDEGGDLAASLQQVRDAERKVYDARCAVLNDKLSGELQKNKKMTPLEVAQFLFETSDEAISDVRTQRKQLDAQREAIKKQRDDLFEQFKSTHPKLNPQQLTLEWNEDPQGEALKKQMDDLDAQISALRDNTSYLERDDTTIAVMV